MEECDYKYCCEDCEYIEENIYGDEYYCNNEDNWVMWHCLIIPTEKACKFFKLQKPSDIFNDIEHPKHYCSGSIECIDAIKSAMPDAEFRGYLRGCIMKYLWRYDKKGSKIKDLKKAMFYLNRLLDELGSE